MASALHAGAPAAAHALRGAAAARRQPLCAAPAPLPQPAAAAARTQRLRAAARSAAQEEAVAPEARAHPEPRPFNQEDWDRFLSAYVSCYEEHMLPITPDMVEGTIPAELCGSYLRNGPGLFEIGGTKVPQPFDGDGMVTCVSFHDGAALLRNRYVRTDAFVAEQAAGRMLYQGVFNRDGGGGLLNNPLALEVKRVANTGVLNWGGRILALYEADLPYELSPELHTLGTSTLDGSMAGVKAVAAHYRVLTQPDGSRRWVAFGTQMEGVADSAVSFWEYDEGGRCVAQRRDVLKGAAFGFFHDMLATANYYVLLENPIQLDLMDVVTRYVPKRASFAECLKFVEDKPCRLHLFPRGGGAVRSFELPASFFSFHHINAYEEAGQLVLDTVALLGGVDFSINMDTAGVEYYARHDTADGGSSDDNSPQVGRGVALRLVVDPETGRVAPHKLFTRSCEFPSVAPAAAGRRHRHAYATCDDIDHPDYFAPPQSLMKMTLPEGGGPVPSSVDVEVWNPGMTRFAQEPLFVPRPGGTAEDEGWVLAYVYDSDRRGTDLVIVDAQRFGEGPVATVRLPFILPPGLHGSWSGQMIGPDPKAPPLPSSYDIRRGVSNADGSYKYE